MHTPAITELPIFAILQSLANASQSITLLDRFASDPNRFHRFSLPAAGLFLDYSKNHVDAEIMASLVELARERGLESYRDAMFAGEKINITENRSVLHTALRLPRTASLPLDGHDIVPDIHAVLDRMHSFSDLVRSGEWLGCTGKRITDIVNIGIGGSDLGPKMACLALRPFGSADLSMHFVSNVDGHDMDSVLSRIHPETTLFVIASKTFTTSETMLNASTAKSWFHASGYGASDLPKHFAAVSTNTAAVSAFGIDTANMFPFWDWVGGRYSVWSAIGLPLMLYVGYERFMEFLSGAHEMDQHFREAPLGANMPTILALIGFWNGQFRGARSRVIAPYHQDLSRFPAYLQQLEMESNGKRVTRDGLPVGIPTCPVVWGECGTNSQHAYFQLLHQGTDIIPADFIAAMRPSHAIPRHHTALLANCFAQSEALMRGKNEAEVREMLTCECPSDVVERLLPHRVFPGNRPSNTILMDELTPKNLGALIALYEHQTFVQGVLWGVNSFDQWGVELGKVLAKQIESELVDAPLSDMHDGSTNGLIEMVRRNSEK